ncbi:MAG: chromosomal replication initiator protein DnaA [Patescibacteria group bacterium]|nr:MAG: chromosomal replication initiator protein DnaA [Patescibacteria group bacterium]
MSHKPYPPTMENNKQLWSSATTEIELHVSKANFSTWFKNTGILKQDGGVVFLGVPNEFVKDWLYNKYHKFILKALRSCGENVRGLEYVICKTDPKLQEQDEKQDIKALTNTELPLKDLYINKEDNLNPRYVFDSFVIGSFNELAHAAAQAILKRPGHVYNPLFVHGGTGLGKTHLIQAVGNYIKGSDPKKKVYYVTSEKFSMDYINSVQANKINSFKEKYRRYDVFIMDDIQFLSGKEKTQEELFHVFNALYEQNKQIIFSSDQHPNYIPNLKERLKSRFSAGMIVDVQQPEYESRVAILRSKSSLNNFSMTDETSQYLASVIQGNIRELEGVLNLVICQSQLKNRSLTLNEIKSIIKNNIKQRRSVSVKDVVKIVTEFYNIEEGMVYEKTRRKEVVKPRQIIMYILREDFNVSYPSIGQKLGGRDHTTVIHSCEKIRGDLKKDGLLVQEIDRIRAMF